MSDMKDIKEAASLAMDTLEKIVQLRSLLKDGQLEKIIARKIKAMSDKVLLYIVNNHSAFELKYWRERILAMEILVDRGANYLDERKQIIERALFSSACADNDYRVRRKGTEMLNKTVKAERIVELTEDFFAK